jgi:hypothetical protein
MTEYNGHRSFNAWNVALWLNNDEELYNLIRRMPEHFSLRKAVNTLLDILPARTPDGAVYNRLCIKLAIQEEFEATITPTTEHGKLAKKMHAKGKLVYFNGDLEIV